MIAVDARHVKQMFPVKQRCWEFETAAALFKDGHGFYPLESNAMTDLITDEYCRKILKSTNLVDPWGTVFRYRLVYGRPVVDSAGPDKRFDTADDIRSLRMISVH